MSYYFHSNSNSFLPSPSSNHFSPLPVWMSPTRQEPLEDNFGDTLPHQQGLQWNIFQSPQPLQQPEQFGLLSHIKDLLKQSLEDVSKIQKIIETRFFEVKTEPKFEDDSNYIIIKDEEEESIKEEGSDIFEPNSSSLEEKIDYMLCSILVNYDDTLEETFRERKKYQYNQEFNELLDVFDEVIKRYQAANKHREDMLRFIMRKAINTICKSYRKSKKVRLKEVLANLCKKYCSDKFDELSQNNLLENEEKLVDYLFPEKKNSRIKTISPRYIKEIFTYDEFYQDYLQFYEKFDEIIETDREIKKNKFVKFLCTCVENDDLSPIKNYRRIPWLHSWAKTTKVLARELKISRGWNGQSQLKLEYHKY